LPGSEETKGHAFDGFGLIQETMSVAEIKEAVNKLPVQERLKLLAELCDWPDDEWDRQMKRDAAAGKFAWLNEEAAQAVKSGKVKPLEEGLAGE